MLNYIIYFFVLAGIILIFTYSAATRVPASPLAMYRIELVSWLYWCLISVFLAIGAVFALVSLLKSKMSWQSYLAVFFLAIGFVIFSWFFIAFFSNIINSAKDGFGSKTILVKDNIAIYSIYMGGETDAYYVKTVKDGKSYEIPYYVYRNQIKRYIDKNKWDGFPYSEKDAYFLDGIYCLKFLSNSGRLLEVEKCTPQ